MFLSEDFMIDLTKFKGGMLIMSKITNSIKNTIRNISPFNNRTEMPVILYIIKVIIIFEFVKFGAEVIGEGIVLGALFACGKNPLKGEMFSPNVMTLIMYFGYGLLIGIAILYWKVFQKKSVSELGFTKNVGSYFIGGIIGAVLVTVSVLFILLTGTIKYKGVYTDINYLYIFLMLGGFIFQGAWEEVLCRGIVLQLLKEKVSIPVAVGISTIFFIYPHISNMQNTDVCIKLFAIIGLILISLIFSCLTIYFKNIWVACGLHTIWNYILYNILGLNLSGNDEVTAAVFEMKSVGSNVINGGVYGIEASAVTAVVLAVALVGFYVIGSKTRKSKMVKAA